MKIAYTEVLCTAALLAGLSTQALAVEQTELNVLYSNAYVLKPVMERIGHDFAAAHPNVKIVYSDVRNYSDMAELTLRAAITGDMPDVAFQGTSFIELFANRELAVPLDGLIKAESNWDSLGYYSSMTSIASAGGKTYGIPFAIAVPVIYYNASLVKAAGGDPDHLPDEWPGIVDLAKRINTPSGGIYFDYGATANWTFVSLIQAQGGQMMKDGKIAFDGEEGMTALKVLESIGTAGMVDMGRDQAKQAFASGTLGIFVTSSSDIQKYEREAESKFQVKVMPFPMSNPAGRIPAGGNAAVIHTKNPAKQAIAWEYIKFATSPIAQTEMVKEASYLPSSRIAVESDKHLEGYYQDHPNLQVPVRLLPNVGPFFSFPGDKSVKITKVIQDQLQAVLTLKSKPEDAMKQMSKSVTALLP
ncbi:ABC transporter substrate-binding protein [Sinorhizobium meliloti]|uniref:ABC transporter substrate-binding protein n=1 Tax=Rhizobium meliloti TaxID=382 RepID=UPI000FD46A30|nr:ABC transporter substrate-binding protein [Sinorhizobium meliloti]RVJ70742.1 ABC transporter substrate-binding protein [Sinorhizobium meliloti]